jgi:hypothetical protein
MNLQVKEYIMKARILVVIDGCTLCAKYKEFIERENLTVPINKRVRVINATNFNSLGVTDYPILNVLDKYMKGSFPFLFFDGILLNGANSKDEAEAFIRGAFNKDLIVKVENPFLFTKNCKYVKRGFFGKRTLVCGDEY